MTRSKKSDARNIERLREVVDRISEETRGEFNEEFWIKLDH